MKYKAYVPGFPVNQEVLGAPVLFPLAVSFHSLYRCVMYTVELKVQIDKKTTTISACTIIALLSTVS